VRKLELKRLTTLGVGGPAELWEVESEAALKVATAEPFRVLGSGANLLIADAGVPERVLRLGRSYNDLKVFTGEREVWLGAATPLPGLVRRAAAAGLSGLEGLAGVPANLGGAIAMNAGTRYGEMAGALAEVELFVNGGTERVGADALGLCYRHSHLPAGAVITRAKLKLIPSSPERVQRLMAKVDAARQTQPKIKSAGCAFKNPPGESAGRLIDHAGLKGTRIGRAMVALEHGNFMVNLGGATAAEMWQLIKLVRARVAEPLELEWQLWGVPEGSHE
jgi:UDP-N-acetylmuramate dehydrogenase